MKQCEVLFVGTLVAEGMDQSNPAFSAAGQLFQKCMTDSLSTVPDVGMSLISVMPVPAFPKSRKLLVFVRPHRTVQGRSWWFLPYINITPVKQLCAGLVLCWMAIRWRMQVRGARIRILYQYNLTMPPGIFSWVAARLAGARFAASVNDIDSPGVTVSDSIWRRMDFAAQKFLIRRVDKLVVVSNAIVDDFCPKRQDHILIEGGVDASRFEQPLRSASDQQSKEGTFRFGFAGALELINGVDLILDAFNRIEDRRVRLLIAGRGALEPLVRRRAVEDPRITFIGLVSHDEVLRMYEICDALLNVRITKTIDSRYFFPSKLMEYLASGVPVISTPTGVVRDVYAHYCEILEQETPEALSELMARLARGSKQQQLLRAQAGREFVLEQRSWKAQAVRIAEYLRS